MGNKRLYERIAAIVTICTAALCCLMFVMLIAVGRDAVYNILIEMNDPTITDVAAAAVDLIMGMSAFEIPLCIVTIVIASLYLGMKKSKALSLGLGIPLCILVGVNTILTFIIGLFPLPLGFAAGFVFLILSLVAKNTGNAVMTRITYVGDPYSGGGAKPIDPFDGTPMSGSRAIDPFDGRPMPGAEESLEKKLADLKKLREMDVISEQQYRDAVDRLVKHTLGDDRPVSPQPPVPPQPSNTEPTAAEEHPGSDNTSDNKPDNKSE